MAPTISRQLRHHGGRVLLRGDVPRGSVVQGGVGGRGEGVPRDVIMTNQNAGHFQHAMRARLYYNTA